LQAESIEHALLHETPVGHLCCLLDDEPEQQIAAVAVRPALPWIELEQRLRRLDQFEQRGVVIAPARCLEHVVAGARIAAQPGSVIEELAQADLTGARKLRQ
jgi:hypothetical protein